jgi:hypothetical protein
MKIILGVCLFKKDIYRGEKGEVYEGGTSSCSGLPALVYKNL